MVANVQHNENPIRLDRRRVAMVGLTLALAMTSPLKAFAKRLFAKAQELSPAGNPVAVKEVARSATTTSGTPIRMPTGPVEAVTSTYDIPRGATLPIHRHEYPRFGYVLSGVIRVTNVETGNSHVFRAGDVIAEDVGVWHQAQNDGDFAVELLVMDFVPPGLTNVEQAGGPSQPQRGMPESSGRSGAR